MHVVRCFEDPDVQHVMGAVDPVRDREVINIELALADLAAVEKRLDKTVRTAKSGDKQAKVEARLLEQVQAALSAGQPRPGGQADRRGASPPIAAFNLLTAKPVLYAANVPEAEVVTGNAHVAALAGRNRRHPPRTAEVVTFSGKVEAELAELPPEDREGLPRVAGRRPSPVSTAWRMPPTICSACRPTSPPARRRSAPGPSTGATRPPQAAGVIHSDFEKGFIRAETVAYAEFVRVGGWKPAREQGLARAEGKEYVVQDGDVMLFRFNV